MTDRLFVYGTLAPGRANEHVLQGASGTWEAAIVRGHLFEQGWGAAMGFPGIVLDDAGPEVQGLLFTSEQLTELWPHLDDFEGDGYERVQTLASLPGGETFTTYIYVLRGLSPTDLDDLAASG